MFPQLGEEEKKERNELPYPDKGEELTNGKSNRPKTKF